MQCRSLAFTQEKKEHTFSLSIHISIGINESSCIKHHQQVAFESVLLLPTNVLHPVWWRSGLGRSAGARSGSGDLTPDGSNRSGEGLWIKSLCNLAKLFLSMALAWKNTAAESRKAFYCSVSHSLAQGPNRWALKY